MVRSKQTLASLKRFMFSETTRGVRSVDIVRVAPRFMKWLADSPNSYYGVEYTPEPPEFCTLQFEGCENDGEPRGFSLKFTASAQENFAVYKSGTWIIQRYYSFVTPREHYKLRQVTQQEQDDGWVFGGDIKEKPVDFWDVIHWISDPDRRPHMYVPLLGHATTAITFHEGKMGDALALEFKLRFG